MTHERVNPEEIKNLQIIKLKEERNILINSIPKRSTTKNIIIRNYSGVNLTVEPESGETIPITIADTVMIYTTVQNTLIERFKFTTAASNPTVTIQQGSTLIVEGLPIDSEVFTKLGDVNTFDYIAVYDSVEIMP